MRDVNIIVEEFFNLELPCPPEVPMCDKVREAYKEELKKLEANPGGCSQCQKNGVKSKFLQQIWTEAVTSITQKAS